MKLLTLYDQLSICRPHCFHRIPVRCNTPISSTILIQNTADRKPTNYLEIRKVNHNFLPRHQSAEGNYDGTSGIDIAWGGVGGGGGGGGGGERENCMDDMTCMLNVRSVLGA